MQNEINCLKSFLGIASFDLLNNTKFCQFELIGNSMLKIQLNMVATAILYSLRGYLYISRRHCYSDGSKIFTISYP